MMRSIMIGVVVLGLVAGLFYLADAMGLAATFRGMHGGPAMHGG